MRIYETHYCHNPTCEGRHGFEVRWFEANFDPPIAPEPERDTCPHCGDAMHDAPLEEDPDEPPDESAYLTWGIQ